MIEIYQEAMLPKLSQTSLYKKFDETSQISKMIVEELSKSNQYKVNPSDITEILSIIKLNGDPLVRKAVAAYEKGKIVIINNKEISRIPMSLPYLTVSKGETTAYVFANNIVNDIKSTREYTSLMAALEAAYLALRLAETPNKFLADAQLMMSLCNIYQFMILAPLEQRMFMKGDHLTKAQLYTIGYFYKMIKDDLYDPRTVPYKRICLDRMDPVMAEEIFEEYKDVQNLDFNVLLDKFTKINPVRYKDLKNLYLTHFISTCGTPIIFAIENLSYLFMLISSAVYKTPLTQYSVNKLEGQYCRRIITLMNSMDI